MAGKVRMSLLIRRKNQSRDWIEAQSRLQPEAGLLEYHANAETYTGVDAVINEIAIRGGVVVDIYVVAIAPIEHRVPNEEAVIATEVPTTKARVEVVPVKMSCHRGGAVTAIVMPGVGADVPTASAMSVSLTERWDSNDEKSKNQIK